MSFMRPLPTTFWFSLFFSLALLLGWVGPVHAWSAKGHHVIAELALAQLTPTARAGLQRLLALEPGTTLASASTWADEQRTPATAAWHYVNLPPGDCRYLPRRDCPDGQCIVEALRAQLHILASSASDEQRLVALKFVAHLLGDLHQPLHAGYAHDRGGNGHPLKEFNGATNLHALWDFGLVRQSGERTRTLVKRLQKMRQPVQEVDAAALAQEACRIVATPGFYPQGDVDPAYLRQFVPVMERQLVLAGARLAATLNRVLR